MKYLIVGATSAIAEAIASRWADESGAFCLMARDKERLESLAQHLGSLGAQRVETHSFEAQDILPGVSQIQSAWSDWQGFDRVVIAHGMLKPDQDDADAINRFLMINSNSVIGQLESLVKLATDQATQIVILGSVAGDRGRKSNYLYGASKAALETWAEGANHLLRDARCSLMLVKPGMIDTPMTQAFKKGPLWSTPERVAEDIDKGLKRNKQVIYSPGYWRYIMLIIRLLPRALFQRLNL